MKKLKQHHEDSDKPFFGFWVYLMTDLALFATLFATYAVLRNNTFGGPAGNDIFDMPYVLVETLVLLLSSFTAGLAMIAARAGKKNNTIGLFAVTFLLGLVFIGMEINEFKNLVEEGHSWRESGFLSAFFTLVGTHGIHISAGLIWMAVMIQQVAKKGLKSSVIKRLTLLSMFWHFLDIVWIFIFTIVFLMGVA
jgi:cytochrome o ubiquinol oxidase subunit III